MTLKDLPGLGEKQKNQQTEFVYANTNLIKNSW